MSNTELTQLTLINVKQIDAFDMVCKCGYINRPDNFHRICPVCGRDLKIFTLTDIVKPTITDDMKNIKIEGD